MEIENIDSGSSISDEDFMSHILNNLPEEYDVIVNNLEDHLGPGGRGRISVGATPTRQ